MAESTREVEAREAAKRNVELGWCPCGEELDYECECGISRLSFAQGKALPVERFSEPRRLSPDGETR